MGISITLQDVVKQFGMSDNVFDLKQDMDFATRRVE